MNKPYSAKTRVILTALFLLPTLFISLNYLPALIHCMAAAMVYIGFRDSIPMAARALKDSGLKDPVFIPNPVYRNLAIIFLLLCAFGELYWVPTVNGFIAIGCGFIFIAKLRELHHRELLRQGYIPAYYLLQLLGGCGYLWLGICQITAHPTEIPLYFIVLGYLVGAILLSVIFRTKT